MKPTSREKRPNKNTPKPQSFSFLQCFSIGIFGMITGAAIAIGVMHNLPTPTETVYIEVPAEPVVTPDEEEQFQLLVTTRHSIDTPEGDNILFDISSAQFSDELKPYAPYITYETSTGLVSLTGYFNEKSSTKLFAITAVPEEDLETTIETIVLSTQSAYSSESEMDVYIQEKLSTLNQTEVSGETFRSFCELVTNERPDGTTRYWLEYPREYTFEDFGRICSHLTFTIVENYLIYSFASPVDASEPAVKLDSIYIQ